MKTMFQNANSKELVGLYSYSVAIEPIRHLHHDVMVQCTNCSEEYAFGSLAFKPRFDSGQAIFHLHCQSCGHTAEHDKMTEAALKLLENLSA